MLATSPTRGKWPIPSEPAISSGALSSKSSRSRPIASATSARDFVGMEATSELGDRRRLKGPERKNAVALLVPSGSSGWRGSFGRRHAPSAGRAGPRACGCASRSLKSIAASRPRSRLWRTASSRSWSQRGSESCGPTRKRLRRPSRRSVPSAKRLKTRSWPSSWPGCPI